MTSRNQLGEAAYRSHLYVSNSDLSKMVNGWLNLAAFRMGTLTHSVILELDKVNLITGTIQGYDYVYKPEEINLTLAMRKSFLSDGFCRDFLASCSVEVEMYDQNTRFEDIALDTKRKYDLWNYAASWGGDLKSTSATTREEFLHHVKTLHYDRGRVFYAKGSGAKQDIIIGVSKVFPHKLFPVIMKEGDDLWTSGTIKCNALAKQHHELYPPF